MANPFSAYLPADRRVALAQQRALPAHARGAALFADISGFTALTNTLAKALGPKRGAEEIARHVNAVYDALVEEVHRYEGNIISFSGDAMLCWFESTTLALICAVAQQSTMRSFASIPLPNQENVTLGIKIGVSAGTARRMLVGDEKVCLIEVLAGQAVERAAQAEQIARIGEIVTDEDTARIAELAGFSVQERRIAPDKKKFASMAGARPTGRLQAAPLPEIPAEQAAHWVIPPVAERLRQGQEEYLTELRLAVTMFVAFHGIDYDNDEQAAQKTNSYTRWAQSVLTRYEGHLLGLNMGDKGSHFYAAFGAPSGHEDDPARALAAARELCNPPSALNFIQGTRIGISRGQVLCGAYGGRARRAYGMLGNDVNIAARLMSIAHEGEIIMSERAALAAPALADLEKLPPVEIKGIAHPLPIYALNAGLARASGVLTRKSAQVQANPTGTIVGRASERTRLAEHLEALASHARGGTLIIEGESGIGKSRLIADLLWRAEALDIKTLNVAGNAIESATPYYAWREIFTQMLGALDTQRMRALLLERLHAVDKQWIALASLFNSLLPLEMPETELVAQMDAETRAETLRTMLKALFRQSANQGTLLIVLDDAQWIDAASWALMRAIAQETPHALFVIGTRPQNEAPAEYVLFLKEHGAETIRLGPLGDSDVEALLRLQLGVADIALPILRFVKNKAEGHPFFSEEIVYALRDKGLLELKDGTCRLSREAGNLNDLDFPDTIEGVITSRIDLLSAQEQLTLKVGSVLGRNFAYPTLRQVHPVESDRPAVITHLARLETLDITLRETPDPHATYFFKHIITQEVAYGLMTSEQRRDMHQRVARWYEETYHENLAPHYPLIAHHWRKAGNNSKTIDYLEKAGEEAMRNFANDAAIVFYEEVLALDKQNKSIVSVPRRAQWKMNLGRAYTTVSQYEKGQALIEEGLDMIGYPMPSANNPTRQTLQLLSEMAIQALHRLWPARFMGAQSDKREILLSAYRSYARLVEVYYYGGALIAATCANFRGANIVELAGPSDELAEAYGPIAVAFEYFGLHGVAASYARRTREALSENAGLSTRMLVYTTLGSYYTGAGQWQAAREQFDLLLLVARPFKDSLLYRFGLRLLSYVYQMQGEFAEGMQLIEPLCAPELAHSDPRLHASGLCNKAMSLLCLGRVAEALTTIAETNAILDNNKTIVDLPLRIQALGVTTSAHWAAQEWEAARESTRRIDALTREFSAISDKALQGYCATAETHLGLWQRGERAERAPALTATQNLERLARVFVIGLPRAHLCRGYVEELDGQRARALKHWRTGLAHARKLSMPYEQARLHTLLARYESDTNVALAHEQEARTLFERCGALGDLKSLSRD